MKKIMGMRRAKVCTSVIRHFFSGTYPKIVESDQKSSLVAPPMSYHEFAHECSSLNLIFGYPRIRNYCRTFS